jgi:fucose 4-O-acetylase-like acetyltransferase
MKREAFFDNARLFLIFLVVFGHMIQPFMIESTVISVIYRFIYLFHMPAMILLSGFFAKGIGKAGYLLDLTRKLLIPYLIFQLVYTSYYYFTGSSGWDASLSEPHWSLWFLLSLFSWHILLIFFKKIHPVLGISITVALGLIVGYIEVIGHEYSISRTVVFFPFFLAGYWLTKEQLFKWKRPVFQFSSVVFAILVITVLLITPDFPVQWMFGSVSYTYLQAPQFGAFIRLGFYLLAILLTCSVYIWIPRQHYKVTKFGKQTIYVYLLHGFFIQFLRENDLLRLEDGFDLAFIALLSFSIVLLLSSKVVFLSFQPVIEGRLTGIKQLITKETF